VSRVAALALAVLVVLAGCGGLGGDGAEPTSPSSPVGTTTTTGAPATATTETTAENATIAVEEGTLPANATRVFERVRTVLGSDAAAPESVVVGGGSGPTGFGGVRPFWGVVGVTAVEPDGPSPVAESGYTTGLGTVVVSPGSGSNASAVRTVLAHEFVHYVQFAEGSDARLRETLPSTTDGEFVVRALLEGVAVTATDAYLERHHPEARPNGALYERIAAAYPAGSLQRYGNAQYVAGSAYVAARLDDPAATESLYERPPRTGEQVLHGLAPGVEPPRALSTDVSTGAFTEVGRDTLGEPFVRTALAGAVDEPTAASAATGWGNDTLVTVRDGDAVGYAWTLRWDDAANATEARNAFAVLLSSLSSDARLVTVDDETFTVLLGDVGVVEETSVREGDGDEVTLAFP
jgi:hypothetical protein